MRQIKFRGKCQRGYDYSNGDGWVYGSLLQKDKVCAIVKTEDIDLSPKTDDGYSFVEDFGCVPVITETVGQFTGLTDKNGKEIYEGDVVRVVIYSHFRKNEVISDTLCPVSFKDGIFGITHGNRSEFKSFSAFSYNVSFEVIGNIHINPELLIPQ